MNIYDYADALNLQLVVRRYPNQNGRFAAFKLAVAIQSEKEKGNGN